MAKRAQIRAQVSPWKKSVEILITDGRSYCTDIIMTTPKDEVAMMPSLELNPSDAQSLMDDLWLAGLRPSEGSGSAGSLRATEKHLKDMRRIAFNQLGIEG